MEKGGKEEGKEKQRKVTRLPLKELVDNETKKSQPLSVKEFVCQKKFTV